MPLLNSAYYSNKKNLKAALGDVVRVINKDAVQETKLLPGTPAKIRTAMRLARTIIEDINTLSTTFLYIRPAGWLVSRWLDQPITIVRKISGSAVGGL